MSDESFPFKGLKAVAMAEYFSREMPKHCVFFAKDKSQQDPLIAALHSYATDEVDEEPRAEPDASASCTSCGEVLDLWDAEDGSVIIRDTGWSFYKVS